MVQVRGGNVEPTCDNARPMPDHDAGLSVTLSRHLDAHCHAHVGVHPYADSCAVTASSSTYSRRQGHRPPMPHRALSTLTNAVVHNAMLLHSYCV